MTKLAIVKISKHRFHSPSEAFGIAMEKSSAQRAKEKEEFEVLLKEAGIERPDYSNENIYEFDECSP